MNLNNSVVKGALMLLLTSLLSVITHLKDDTFSWVLFGLVTAGTMLGYFAQSAWFPATSDSGQINLKDILKGLFVSGSNAISTWAATVVTGVKLDWGELGITVAGMFIGYLLKQFNTEAPKS